MRASYAGSRRSVSTSPALIPRAPLAMSNRSRMRSPIAGSPGPSRRRTFSSSPGDAAACSARTTSAAVT